MTGKRRKWGSLSERNGKWVARWQENGKRRQKGGLASRNAGERFLQDKELELFREGFVPDPHPLANAMEIAIESIDALRAAADEEGAPPAMADAAEALDAFDPIDLDVLEPGDVVIVELADRPRRRVHGAVIDLDRDDADRVRAVTLAVRLGANQIAGVLGRQQPI